MVNLNYLQKLSVITFVSLAILVGIIDVVPAFGANNPYLGCPDCNDTKNIQQIPPIAITVTTDKPVYYDGSHIMVTGHVANPSYGGSIAVTIFNPVGQVVLVNQPSIDNNGDFMIVIDTTRGGDWSVNGQYTVKVQQGNNQTIFNSTTFSFTHEVSSNNSTGNPNNPYLGCPDCNQTTTSHANNPYLGCPDCNGTTNAPASTTTPTTATPAKIPNWVKGVFNFYAEGKLSDDDLIKALQFLIQQGIIKVS